MQQKNIMVTPSRGDRMGQFIGRIRDHEKITLAQLSLGLCSPGHLNRIENGEREVGKLLTDTFFQRLGKPVEMFERILSWEEFQQWKQRQIITDCLRHGDIENARLNAQAYLEKYDSILDKQFLQIIEINCCSLSGATAAELLQMVTDALKLTQPMFEQMDIELMLLSQNEGRLLFAYLQLQEKMKGLYAVAESYHKLLRLFHHSRYESRERVYLLPYIALRVIEHYHSEGQHSMALVICEETLNDLKSAKRLFAFMDLLRWKEQLQKEMHQIDELISDEILNLTQVMAYTPECADLLIPCDERGNVYCVNHVIRSRRILFNISQEELSSGICLPHTLSRIENCMGKLRRNNRRALLQKVNMSGERYDYEVVTASYDDYLMRSELDRALTLKDWKKVYPLFAELRARAPETLTNNQYFAKKEASILLDLPIGHSKKISHAEYLQRIRDATNLTLPLALETIEEWPLCTLSVNEVLCLIAAANAYKRELNYDMSLKILLFVYNSLKNNDVGGTVICYEDLYTRVGVRLASVLNDLGRYHEALDLLQECLRLSLLQGAANRVAQYFYAMSCNYSALAQELPEHEREEIISHALLLLRLAYTAATIFKDKNGQRFIAQYGVETFGVELG